MTEVTGTTIYTPGEAKTNFAIACTIALAFFALSAILLYRNFDRNLPICVVMTLMGAAFVGVTGLDAVRTVRRYRGAA